MASVTAETPRWALVQVNVPLNVDDVLNLVHDLRQEVMHLVVIIEALHMDAAEMGLPVELLSESRRQAVQTIDQMTDLLDGLLDTARQGSLALHPSPTNMLELLETITARIMPRFVSAGCQLTIEPPSGPLPDVVCDSVYITRVLMNVLNNALIYTTGYHQSAGSGSAVVPAVRVVISQENDQVVCRVIDNGPGIAPENLVHLGQRFTRVAAGPNTPKGVGLGLSICRRILELSGGSFTLESEGLGHGATAVLRLPCASTVIGKSVVYM